METTPGQNPAPSVLLLDDGELDDVHEVLLTLTDDIVRLRGGNIPARVDPPKHLFVASSRRAVVAGNWVTSTTGPVRVAVVTDDSNTLRSMLRRIGFDMLVRRPFHPYALRLLCLRALYAGDERRRETRAPIGAEIHYRQGLRRRSAILADLSLRGCRLLSKRNLQTGSRVTLQPDRAMVGAKPIPIRAKVVRSTALTREDGSQQWSIGLLFEEMTLDAKRQVHRVLQGSRDLAVLSREAAKAHGAQTKQDVRKAAEARKPKKPAPDVPAVVPPPEPNGIEMEFSEEEDITEGSPFIHEPNLYSQDGLSEFVDREAPRAGADAEDAPEVESDEAPTPTDALESAAAESESFDAPTEPPVDEDDAPTIPDALDDEDDPVVVSEEHGGDADSLPSAGPGSPDERRKEKRARYDQQITQLGERAERVLVGRDISAGGMRVDPQPDLMPGMKLSLAVYGDAREEPLVVAAEVIRNEGPEGVALQFENVPQEIGERLENLVLSLPGVESLQEGEDNNIGTVISEILEGDLFDPISED